MAHYYSCIVSDSMARGASALLTADPRWWLGLVWKDVGTWPHRLTNDPAFHCCAAVIRGAHCWPRGMTLPEDRLVGAKTPGDRYIKKVTAGLRGPEAHAERAPIRQQ